ncbi:retinoid-inducible serine carboxypeptidase [Protopterus annectens]|uniref:retinoid-inducible serine carboxypeptidase n=1 Tax=Protopterus annectens TaxID=7888 RepID=UPI001CF9FCFA|nr:retinoid-inducible serine carboxypeptidase [Protopterus annectens]
MVWLATVVVTLLYSCCSGVYLPAEPKEEWGYVKVRDDANMFWWLYYADSPSVNFRNLPLVMWLQEEWQELQRTRSFLDDFGFKQADQVDNWVSMSKRDYENMLNDLILVQDDYVELMNNPLARFNEELFEILEKGEKLGFLSNKDVKRLFIKEPKDPKFYALPKLHKNLRSPPGSPIVSILQASSLLFVDNPVGTGYSYTTNSEAFAKNVSTVASDMIALLKEFFQSKVDFQAVPFYIFSESYGGKMAAAISLALNEAIQKGIVKCKFSGVALGDSWISPLDSVISWGPYLYSTSLLDDEGLEEVTAAAKDVQDAVEKGDFRLATELWSKAETVVESNTDNVSFYNILKKDVAKSTKAGVFQTRFLASSYHRHVQFMHTTSLDELMNGPIRKKLGIIPDSVTWGGQSENVFANMAGDFMKPVINLVDKLLASNTNVTVYNGQLDLIVDTVGKDLYIYRSLIFLLCMESVIDIEKGIFHCPKNVQNIEKENVSERTTSIFSYQVSDPDSKESVSSDGLMEGFSSETIPGMNQSFQLEHNLPLFDCTFCIDQLDVHRECCVSRCSYFIIYSWIYVLEDDGCSKGGAPLDLTFKSSYITVDLNTVRSHRDLIRHSDSCKASQS